MEALAARIDPSRWYLFTKRGDRRYDQVEYQEGDALIFGSESKGLSASLREAYPDRGIFLPILGNVRSINLSAAVHVAVYEASRQKKFKNFA